MSVSRLASVLVLLALSTTALAQPTYKLDVKKELEPRATLSLSGETLTRSAVRDDPGFRLQYHFQKDGKTLATPDARAEGRIRLPSLEAGTYTVVLELFHPGYKGGTASKGEFKPVSAVLSYRIEAGKPDKITVVPPAKPMPPAEKKKP
jgi:hypothetical protein